MVTTRSGHDVFHTEASYGRAAKKETTRRRLKRKLESTVLQQHETEEGGVDRNTTPRRRQTRAQIRQLEELDTPPSALTRVAITPPNVTERFLRGRTPTCSDYGTSRNILFGGNDFFFCSPCNLWDSLPPDRDKRCSRVSVRFACKAKHKHFSHPTTLCDSYGRMKDSEVHVAPCEIATTLLNDNSDCSTGLAESLTARSDGAGNDDDSAFAGSVDSTSTSLCENSENAATELANQPLPIQLCAGEGPSSALHSTSSPGTQQDSAEELMRKVQMLRSWNLKLARELKKLREQEAATSLHTATSNETAGAVNTNPQSRNTAFQNDVLHAIDSVVKQHRRWGAARIGDLVAKAVCNDEVFFPHVLKLARRHLRKTIFTPFNILREMDLAGGTLSYEGIDVLRRVETSGVKRFRGSIIPSKAEIKRTARVVEWFARQYCPFDLKETNMGEAIQFDYAKTMLCITKAFHLDEIGKERSLSIASSIDGASLSKNLSIIAGGIKVNDLAARCPLTNRLLLDNPATMSAQSRNLCIPLKIMMGRETKETFKEFGTLFKFIDDISDEITMPGAMEGFKAFRSMTNCDLSAQWKGLCKGGAAKVHTLPCTCCATESNSLSTPNSTKCNRWCHEKSDDADWMCFHKPMGTPERVESMRAEVNELVGRLEGALEDIMNESKITRYDVEINTPSEKSTRDPFSIHYCPMNEKELQSFDSLVTNELIVRGMDHDLDGALEIRRESLRVALKGESTINRLSKEISHGEVREGAYFVLMQTLPCVLHMENRNGIKLLTMAFIEGLSNAKNGDIFNNVAAEGTRVSLYIAEVERLINRSILGTDDDPCQWMCPYNAQKKELGPITMDNVRTRRIVDALDIVIEFCVTNEDRKALWTTALNNYRTAMVLLQQREDFTNAMIVSYQSHADKFFQAWVLLWQQEGITNYIHVIGAGHIADYLYKWRNLYRFSQQGWEAMNSLVKTFFFRRTSHGGGVRGASKKSRLTPIARWLQRRLIFLCRINEHDIRQFAVANPLPKNFCTQTVSEYDDVYD